MSDGMTDKRSQPEFASEYISRANFEAIVEAIGVSTMTKLLNDPDFMAETPLTVVELRQIGATAREAAALEIAKKVRIR